MMFPDVSEIELGSSHGRKSSDCTHEVASFGYRVDYDHDGVFSIRFRELCYEIHTGGVPRCIWDWKGMKFSGRWLTNGFGLEAHVTGGDIFTNVPGHLQPPVISRNQF